jgi:transcriptional regulator with XRE-family HTH domain
VAASAVKADLLPQHGERELPEIARNGASAGSSQVPGPEAIIGNPPAWPLVTGTLLIAMTSPSSSAQAARQRLAGQLRDLRLAAGLSGRAFAAAAGCQSSKISQIEKAVRPASLADVKMWCRVCGASEQRTGELLAEQAAAARLWSAYRDIGRHGLNATQKLLVGDIFERVRVHRQYQTKVIPGLLQTHAYMTGIMTAVRRERDDVEVDDVAEAVTERLGRQRILLDRDRQFHFVIEEPVLWFRPFSTAVQRAQLTHLLEMMNLPAVMVGIIPMTHTRQGHRPRETFEITDTTQVNIEMLTGLLVLTYRAEVDAYIRAWEELDSIAVHHARARALIRRVITALDELPPEGDAHGEE